MPAIPSWLLEPLWDQFAALLPGRPVYDPSHPLGCRRPRSPTGSSSKNSSTSYGSAALTRRSPRACWATAIRERRDDGQGRDLGELKQSAGLL